MHTPPTGTVTFLFTDIEGSTQLSQRYPDALPAALARHHAILQHAIESNHGYVFQIVGDSFAAAFATAADALVAAVDTQRALHAEPWGETGPIRVRMGLHTGAAIARNDGYDGYLTLSHVQRLMAAAHGGQMLLSQATETLVRDQLPAGITLRDMGERRLKDFSRPEHIYQLVAPDLPTDFPPLKTLDIRPNNLPVQLTSFIGREPEMAEVKRLLAAARLLTLTGSGGTGKTRLALQLAADALDIFSHGVWLVEFAPLADPALVPQTVATALGVREQASRPILAILSDYLRDKQMLLVLDNCEHLIEACAQLTDQLLHACPPLKILTTSREALGIAGETTFRVPSLQIPKTKDQIPIEQLSQYEAVRLFIERAVAVKPDFHVTNANAPAVAQICHHVDGIPLALELAAARVRSLSVEQIAARLDNQFRLLIGGSRTAMPRQQTLRALIDWSHNLLNEQEHMLFRRLAVFAGGWTLEAAEQVCSGADLAADEIIDVLDQLVNKSLVVTEAQDGDSGAVRYRMLETIRQYAREKLLEAGEGERVRDRHLDYFLKLAEEAEPKLYGAQQVIWLDRLLAEHDNLRVALEWSLAVGQTDRGFQLAAALHWFWYLRGFWNEGRAWLQRMLSANTHAPSASRAKALYGIALLTQMQRDITQSATLAQESLSLSREAGDKRGIALALSVLADQAYYQDDYQQATTLGEESAALFREVGDGYYLSQTLGTLGYIAEGAGDYKHALMLYEESLALRRELGDKDGTAYHLYLLGRLAQAQGDDAKATIVLDESLTLFRAVRNTWGIAVALRQLGYLALHQGDYHRVESLLQAGLVLFQKLGDKYGVATVLGGLAGGAAGQGRLVRAAQLFGVAQTLLQALGMSLMPALRPQYERSLATTRAQLGEATFDAAWEAGRQMTMEEAIEFALQE